MSPWVFLMKASRDSLAPVADAVWYSDFGVPLFGLGVIASVVAVRAFAAA
jgi:hypothetical protein